LRPYIFEAYILFACTLIKICKTVDGLKGLKNKQDYYS